MNLVFLCSADIFRSMTTLPSFLSGTAAYEAWRQGRLSLSAEELDFVMFGIDTTNDFGYAGKVDFNVEDFNDFECS